VIVPQVSDEPLPPARGMIETVEPDGSAWVAPVEGDCPLDHPVKANDNSGIFHVPGGRFYDRTKAERCYVDAESAAADGYRAAKA
jgi:micrococcal nuclease